MRPSLFNDFSNALTDLKLGLARWELWVTIGLNEIRQRYRRSLIGPFWITLSMGVMIVGIGNLYARLWHQPAETYLPFLAAGLIFWNFISAMIQDGCQLFVSMGGVIRQVYAPISIYLFQMIWRNIIILAHNIIICVIVLPTFGLYPNWQTLEAIPGFLLILANCAWISLVLGMLCARFRDVPQIILNVMQILFFITPVIWTGDRLSGFEALLQFNPLYHLLELVRTPLLGSSPPLVNWLVSIGMAAAGIPIAIALFGRYRARIAYWI